ncbi:hypothetical protein ACXYUI_27460, partial [Klebsiella pneumoniae]
PGFNWVVLARRRAAPGYWIVNLVAVGLIGAGALALVTATSAVAPRPDLHFGSLTVSPHALQWGVVGFGALVVVNLLQHLRLVDRAAFEVIIG